MTGNMTNSTLGMWQHPVVYGIRRMFYICTPGEASFKDLREVPEYVEQAVPYFFGFVLLETILLALQGRWKSSVRPNDAFSSLSAGTISLFPMLFVRNIEMAAYIWMYNNYCIISLPWDSPWTWWLCMLGVDFGYYWVHRFAHEVNFMWAAHQVHHSSEDYNLTTALRQSMLQRYTSWIFYLPMAFFIPPSIFVVHIQFNLIYQFWIHTEVVSTIGPLEWIMNTPSHHRVHHGRNRYCIDTNYAGVLIIWDRMFGTFTPEDKNDRVVYGLVHPLESWNPIYIQLCHWMYIIKTAWTIPGLQNKTSVFLNGPSWTPGKPRLGLITDIPDIHAPQPRYNKQCALWVTLYTYVHFAFVLLGHQLLMKWKSDVHPFTLFLAMVYLLWAMTNIGFIHEQKWYGRYSELLRCVVYLAADSYLCHSGACSDAAKIPRFIFYISILLCLLIQPVHKKMEKKVQ